MFSVPAISVIAMLLFAVVWAATDTTSEESEGLPVIWIAAVIGSATIYLFGRFLLFTGLG